MRLSVLCKLGGGVRKRLFGPYFGKTTTTRMSAILGVEAISKL
jgi:hypothetical protein